MELLADEFVCEPKGTITVKGKGEIDVWYLVGRRGGAGESPGASDAFRSPEAVPETT